MTDPVYSIKNPIKQTEESTDDAVALKPSVFLQHALNKRQVFEPVTSA